MRHFFSTILILMLAFFWSVPVWAQGMCCKTNDGCVPVEQMNNDCGGYLETSCDSTTECPQLGPSAERASCIKDEECGAGNFCIQAKCYSTGELRQSTDSCKLDTDCNTNGEQGSCSILTFGAKYCRYIANPTNQDSTEGDVKWEPVMPKLQINIPTLQPFTSEGLKNADVAGYAYIPFLGQYIAGIYKWAVMVGAIVAMIIILFGGLMYVVSRGDAAQISSAKERIQGALVGLFLLLGSYTMLYLINPDLVTFKSLKVQVIDRKTFTVEDEDDSVEGSTPGSVAVVSGNNISNPAGKQLTPEMITAVQQAAKSLKTAGIQLYITDGYRSFEDQKRLILLNCKNAPGSFKCDPKPGKPNTCVLRGLKPESCPHTTARAVDLWGFKNGQQCIKQAQCKKSSDDPCRQDPCQAAVIQAMKNAGFCNLSSEAWHFENTDPKKMSSTCN